MRLRNCLLVLLATICFTSFASAQLVAPRIVSVTDEGSDTAITNGVTTQRENDLAGIIVPFGEDVYTFTDRNHQYNGARFTAAGALTNVGTPAVDDVIVGLPSYLIGNEYISTRNNNRDNADYKMHVTINTPSRLYLLLDNRIGDPNNTDGPTLGNGVMDWVVNEGWTIVNTGISPNGQPDFGAVDEGGSISDFNNRTNPHSGLAVGPGLSVNQFWSVYTKDFPAGTITLHQQNAGNLNMYGVVVGAIPEPGAFGLLGGAVLMMLGRRRGARN